MLELLDPVADPGDVVRMGRALGLRPRQEPHLLWIAKKAVLEGVPDGWRRTVDAATGAVEFVSVRTGERVRENPSVKVHKEMLRQARVETEREGPPRAVCVAELYRWPPPRHAPGATDERGWPMRTRYVAAAGPWLPFFDYYGRQYWCSLETGEARDEIDAVVRGAAALCLGRWWRGHAARLYVLRLADAVALVEDAWRVTQWNKRRREVVAERMAATLTLQHAVRVWLISRASWLEMLVLLARCETEDEAAHVLPGLVANPIPVMLLRRHVIVLQAAVRAWRASRVSPEGGGGKAADDARRTRQKRAVAEATASARDRMRQLEADMAALQRKRRIEGSQRRSVVRAEKRRVLGGAGEEDSEIQPAMGALRLTRERAPSDDGRGEILSG